MSNYFDRLFDNGTIISRMLAINVSVLKLMVHGRPILCRYTRANSIYALLRVTKVNILTCKFQHRLPISLVSSVRIAQIVVNLDCHLYMLCWLLLVLRHIVVYFGTYNGWKSMRRKKESAESKHRRTQ